MQITPPTIPDKHTEFAKAVAAIADTHGIDRFQMTFRPRFDDRVSPDYDRRIEGDMCIHYSSVDGRGRPSRALSINLKANLVLTIVQEPTSF